MQKQAGTRAENHKGHTQQTPAHQRRPTTLHEPQTAVPQPGSLLLGMALPPTLIPQSVHLVSGLGEELQLGSATRLPGCLQQYGWPDRLQCRL